MNVRPQVQLVLEFDESLLRAVIENPSLGPGAWKDFMVRLLDHNIAAPAWRMGAPPPVVMAIRVGAGTDLGALGEDHFPLDVYGRDEAEIALPRHCELVEIPQVSIGVSPIRCDLVFNKT